MMETGLFQQQTLKLTMTKELSQAIEILQYSTMDLVSFLREQALENPLVEMKDFRPKDRTVRKKHVDSDKNNWMENIGKNYETLHEHLIREASLLYRTPHEQKLIHYIIDQIDENGYLSIHEEETANKFNISVERVEQAIYQIQSLDPAGVGARNLQECILLQIRRLPKRYPLAETIIAEHFELFANKTWKSLAKLLNIELSEIQKVLDFIQVVNPKPGSIFQNEAQTYIIPDVIIEKVDDQFEIMINDEYFPTLAINKDYHQQLISQQDSALKSYVTEKWNQWQWIMKSLEQRKQTLLMVMKEIVNVQIDFFKKGPKFLKPLTMRKIAEAIDVHESTVSRAVRDKFVQTPFGTYEMKYFFTSSIQTMSSEDTSSEIVKQQIQELINNENKQKPLSDQKIAEILEKENNIVISRRTVAKYRDQLGIASSSKRKRY